MSSSRRSVVTALLGACLLIISSAVGPAAASDASADVDRLSAVGRGTFSWPATGRLTQEYGCTGFRLNSRRGRCAFFHNGLDIANKAGTPIHAAAPGVVRYVGWDPYDGSRDPAWVVIVGHAGGVRSWYAHLQPRRAPAAKVGDRVSRGQVIGYMGKTGMATGVHLHFMVQYRGGFVDPYRFLPPGSRKPPKPGQPLFPTRRSPAVRATSVGAMPV